MSCPICGIEPMEGCPRCERCEAPHHEDCWTYNDGCGIYGCDPARARRIAGRTPLPDRATEPGRASAFGAMVGVSSVVLALVLTTCLEGRGMHPASFAWALPALALGAWAGPRLSHTKQVGRILFYGILGPGLTMLIPCAPFLLFEPPSWVVALMVMFYSLVTVPLSLPCAFLTAMFNDPRRASPKRQARWMRGAGRFATLSVAAASLAILPWLLD